MFLEGQTEMMSRLAKNNRFQTIKGVPNLAFNLNLLFNVFHAVFDLLASTFSVKLKNADFLGENMASYYIRLCYFKFVKIYSYISNSEIIKINEKVVKRLNEGKTMPRESAQLVVDVDPFGVLDSSPAYGRAQNQKNQENSKNKHSFPILLSKICLKVVLSIALNRNEAAKNIFYQFRIMEFFYKEIDLEFEINQIKERFHKVRNNAIERVSRATSPKKAFEEQSDESDSKEINIYKKNKKSPFEGKIFKSGESGFVPKLNFNNLSSGNPLKIGSLNQKETQSNNESTVQKHSNLDFVDRGGLPPKISGIKLNLGKFGQKSRQQAQPAQPPNKFSLDFSKLVSKPEKPIEEEEPPQVVSNQKIAPSIGIKLPISDSQKPVPALNFGGQAAQGAGIGKLNLANIERGTPVNMPSFEIDIDDKSSDSSLSIKIDYKEVEKARLAKQMEMGTEKSGPFALINMLPFANKEDPSNYQKPALPIISKLKIVPREEAPEQNLVDEEKEQSKVEVSQSKSSSSSVVGFMGPSNMNPDATAFGISKRSLE